MMSKNCYNERLAIKLQFVAIGSMIIMAGAAGSQVLRDAFGSWPGAYPVAVALALQGVSLDT